VTSEKCCKRISTRAGALVAVEEAMQELPSFLALLKWVRFPVSAIPQTILEVVYGFDTFVRLFGGRRRRQAESPSSQPRTVLTALPTPSDVLKIVLTGS